MGVLKILQWNCRSINSSIDELRQFLHEKPHQVLCLQSLNCQKHKLPKLDGFYFPPIVNKPADNNKVYTATYVHTSLSYSLIQPAYNVPGTVHMSLINLKANSNELCLLNCYIPSTPSSKDVMWLQSIDTSFPTLLVGDFNSRHPLWDKSAEKMHINQNALHDQLSESDFCILNTGHHTRIPDRSDQSATVLDLSLCTPDLFPCIDWWVEEEPLQSDHLPISISLYLPDSPSTDTGTTSNGQLPPSFDLSKADWPKFSTLLSSGLDTLHNSDPNIFEENITNHILKAADQSIPQRKFALHPKARPENPWWSDKCQTAKVEKRKTYKRWKNFPSNENHSAMKRAKIKANRVVAEAKKSFFDDTMTKDVRSRYDLSNAWKKIKLMKKEYNIPSPPITRLGQVLTSDADKAEALASEFASVSQSSHLSPEDQKHRESEESSKEMEPPPPDNSLSINAPLTISELDAVISKISSSKVSVGPDGISYEMISHFPPSFRMCNVLA